MQYTIKNTHLTLTVDTLGAQMVSVKNEAGEELLWQADKSVWGYSAPMLFPWVGRMKEGKFLLMVKNLQRPITALSAMLNTPWF